MNERISYIDGLRGVAVLSVVLFHAGVHNAALNGAASTPLSFVLRQGCHGVDLFFILSGFCLAYPALARVHARGTAPFNVSAYGARRIVRIVPPYYAAIAAFTMLGLLLWALHVPLPQPMSPAALSPVEIFRQAFFLDGDRQFLDASFWTLAIEFRWYFVFPLVLWVWVRSPKAFAALAGVAMLAGATRIHSVDLFFLPYFMLGVAAAELHLRRIPALRFALPAAIVSTAIAAAGTAGSGWYFIENGPFWGIAMFCFVVASGATASLRRALSSRFIAGLGTISYGVYLIHEPVVAMIERAAVPSTGAVAGFVAAAAGALVAGAIFSAVAERPFIRSALRERIVANLEPAVRSIFARIGIRDVLELRAAHAQEEAIAA